MLKAPGSSPDRWGILIWSGSAFLHLVVNQRLDYPVILSVERFCHKRKQEKSQDRLGKDVCNSLEIRIKLKLAPTSTLRIGTIN